MSEQQMLYCLIAFILGWMVSKHMGNGFSVDGVKQCINKTDIVAVDDTGKVVIPPLLCRSAPGYNKELCDSTWDEKTCADMGSMCMWNRGNEQQIYPENVKEKRCYYIPSGGNIDPNDIYKHDGLWATEAFPGDCSKLYVNDNGKNYLCEGKGDYGSRNCVVSNTSCQKSQS